MKASFTTFSVGKEAFTDPSKGSTRVNRYPTTILLG